MKANDCQDVFEKFVTEVKDLYIGIDSDESLSFDDVEVCVSDGFRSLEQKFLAMCMSKKTSKKESEPVECPACKAPCRPLRKREKHFDNPLWSNKHKPLGVFL